MLCLYDILILYKKKTEHFFFKKIYLPLHRGISLVPAIRDFLVSSDLI